MCVFVADIKSDPGTAGRQDSDAACTDARCDGRATQGRLRSVAGTLRQPGGHVDTEIQHAVAVLLVVLMRLDVVTVFYYLYFVSTCLWCVCHHLTPTIIYCASIHCQNVNDICRSQICIW